MAETAAQVTVITPMYNDADTVHAALESLQAQTMTAWQCIVIDDGSTDESTHVVETEALLDTRIRLIRNPHGGPARARNTGIDAAVTPWLMFLDADDWIAPNALELLLARTLTRPEVGCVYSSWTVLPVDGEPFGYSYRLDPSETSMFSALSRGCGWALHTAIVRSGLVRAAGSFDPSLVTSEDWDLWVRLARVGTVFDALSENLAFYRLKPGSQAAKGQRMLEDSLRVIDCAHAPDPRILEPIPDFIDGAPPTRRSETRIIHAMYAAGLILGSGESALSVLDAIAEDLAAETALSAVEWIASELYAGLPRATASQMSVWWNLDPAVHAAVDAFLVVLGRVSAIPEAERQVRRLLEAAVFHDLRMPVAAPITLGFTFVISVELSEPVAEVRLPEGADRLHVIPTWGGMPVAPVLIPGGDGRVPGEVVLSACVDRGNAWKVLELMLARETGDGKPALAEPFEDRGWEMLLQRLWGKADWPDPRFYDGSAGGLSAGPPLEVAPEELVIVDPLTPLRDVRSPGAAAATIEFRLAGEPQWRVDVPLSRGRISAQELLVAMNNHAGFELCVAAVRRAATGWAAGDGSFRGALEAAQAATSSPPRAGIVIGQRRTTLPGGPGCRAVVMPVKAAEAILADAVANSESVLWCSSDPKGVMIYDPSLLPDAPMRLRAPGPTHEKTERKGADRQFFETLYASAEDPWGYSVPYEVRKYEQTLELVEPSTNTLEVACAGGHFTRMLAERVRHVAARDVSDLALQRARKRCQEFDNIDYAQLDLFADDLGSGYDVVIASEVFYYAGSAERLRRAISAIERSLRPGGALVAAHANAVVDEPDQPGYTWEVPFGAVGIQRTIESHSRLRLERELRTDFYRVQRFVLEPKGVVKRLRRRSPVQSEPVAAEPPPPEIMETFAPHGGRMIPFAPDARDQTLPVLMYHRISPEGSPAMRQWRVTPEELEQQLQYLRSAEFRSATLLEWQVAVLARQPLAQRSVVLTFDDGYVDFEQHAAPLLDHYGFSATVLVVTDRVGDINVWDAQIEQVPLMDWDALRRMRDQGHEIGGHTATHPRLTALDDGAVVDELARCRRALREQLGGPPRVFASPYGLREPGIDALIGASGFEMALTCESRRAGIGDPLVRIPRLEVMGGMDMTRFIRMVS